MRVIELELWSRPYASAVPLDGKAVAAACRAETGLSAEVVLGLNFVPDWTDVQNLKLLIADAHSTSEAFERFCTQNGLEPNVSNKLSAARFLVYLWGQPLAWLHFPETESGQRMARSVFSWAESTGLVIVAGLEERQLSEAEILALWPH